MLKVPTSPARKIVTAVAAGLVAGAVAGIVDRIGKRLIGPEAKRREKEVREGSAHESAGPYFAGKLLGRELTERGKRRARFAFGVAYGTMWGIVYAGLRDRYSVVPRYLGLPFAIPHFLGCDGGLAPALGVSPGIQRLPWQVNAKELANHLAWTLGAEAVHRLAARIPSSTLDEILSNYPYTHSKASSHERQVDAPEG
jgi:uncharacterized membrane protein YagU involved in acid resistance